MKKGFTLVEVLVVIVLLSIIIAIAIPSISKIRENIIDKEEQTQIKEIKSAASFYARDEKKSNCCITVSELISKGYLKGNEESKVINPKTHEEINVKIYIDNNKKITYDYSETCGNCENN